ncbi:MAG: O-antigen ligase family protein [Clostridia bacterium]|nr:O-antigen ligase family protein [Clostridia bacterium]
MKPNNKLHIAKNTLSLFRIGYITDLFLCSVGYVNIAAEVGKVIFLLWALSLIFSDYIAALRIKKISYFGWLVLFIISNIVTVLLQGYNDGVWESTLMLVHLPVIFFIFYGLHSECDSEDNTKTILYEFYTICNIFMYLSLVLNIISIFSLYIVGKSVTYSFGYLVVYENRFTGVYFNPNLMAFSSFCAAVCCHILLQKKFVLTTTGKAAARAKIITTYVSLILNLAVIFLTDSNATAVIIICYVFTFLCYRIFGGRYINAAFLVKRIILLAAALAFLSVGVFVSRTLFQTGATHTMNDPSSSANTFYDSDDELNEITFEHQNKNLDSGRIKLFKQGINVFKHHPVMGVGKGNIQKYGNRYNNNKMKYSDFHNGYLTILVCSGLIGFLLFAGFAVCLSYRMIKCLFSVKPVIKDDAFPCIVSFIAAYCIYTLFEKAMVFEVSFMVTIFWLFLGYACTYMRSNEGSNYCVYAFSSRFEKKSVDDKGNNTK